MKMLAQDAMRMAQPKDPQTGASTVPGHAVGRRGGVDVDTLLH